MKRRVLPAALLTLACIGATGPTWAETQIESRHFKTSDGEALSSLKNVDLLSLRAYYDNSGKLIGSKSWAGPQPVFKKLWWQAHDK